MAKSDYERESESEEEEEEEEQESDFSPSEDSDDDFMPASKKKKAAAPAKKAKSPAPKKPKAPAKPKTAKPKAQAVKKEGAAKKRASTGSKASGGGGGGAKTPRASKAKAPPAKKKPRKAGSDEDESDDEDDEYARARADGSEDDEGGSEEEGRGGKKKAKAGAGKGKAAAGGGKKGGGGGAKPQKKHEVDKVLAEVRKLMLEQASNSDKPVSVKELGITNVREVVDTGPHGVMFEIEKLVVDTTRSILRGEAFSYTVPTRSTSNQLYIPELDRIVLADKVAQRSFVNHREVRKAAITTRVLSLVHEVLDKGIHITKRDMFYTDVKLFKKQKESDVVLEDVACMLGCPRSCLNVVASEKGLVVGRVQFYEDGDLIDCTRMGVGGKAIPPYIDKITDVQSDAKFILVIEKEAAFLRLAEDRFYNKFPCIVITGKGQPDVATRLFLKKLKAELKIPILGLFDSDPWGLSILTTYMSGSKSMSYDSASLTTGEIKWLGVRPSDLDRYNLPEQCRLDMEPHDIRKGEQLLKEDFVQKNPEWVKELELMLKTKKKAEIQALSAFGFQFITQEYLPQKLTKGDWI